MIRSILALIAVSLIALVVLAPSPALADPSAADMAKAKKAFGAGKVAFDASDFPEAVAKFKESYKLSKNPVLLYNVALANESGGDKDIALTYYRQFLREAPADAATRPDAEARVKVLEKEFAGAGVQTPPGPDATGPSLPVQVQQHKEPAQIKPAGTYSADDFKHQVVDIAPKAKPLDVTAFVPEDSGFTVTLYFRTAGEGKFTAKEMRWRYAELVGRVPAPKMIGESMQYYVECKDQAGNVIARSGKSTSPNLVEITANAPERFYKDWSDEGTGPVVTQTNEQRAADDTEEDPLNKNKRSAKTDEPTGPIGAMGPTGPGGGMRDVGSSKFKYAKWSTTGLAVVGLGLGVVFYISAGNQASALEDDTKMCGTPPCREFDSYAHDLEVAGHRNQTLSNVGFAVGLVGAVGAGYFWYRELTAKQRGELKVSGGSSEKASLSNVQITPVLPAGGEGFAGASAGWKF